MGLKHRYGPLGLRQARPVGLKHRYGPLGPSQAWPVGPSVSRTNNGEGQVKHRRRGTSGDDQEFQRRCKKSNQGIYREGGDR